MTIIITKLFPFFLFILIGFVLSKFNIFKQKDNEGMIKYIYYIGVPSLLFSLITNYELSLRHLPWLVVIGYFLPLIILYFIYFFSWKILLPKTTGKSSNSKLVFNKQDFSIFAFSSVFSNLALLGAPTTLALFGKEGANTLVTILSFHSLLLLSLLIATLEWSKRDKQKSTLLSMTSTTYEILLNPIVVSLLLGFLWNIIGYKIIYPFNNLLTAFSGSVPPVGLVALGGTIYFFSKSFYSKSHFANISYIIIFKNIIAPIIVFISTKYVFHLPLIQVAVATFIAGLPTGVNAFILANQYNTDCKIPSGSIFITTFISIFTLPIILIILQYLN